ncbi:MAG: dTMP kinase [Phycisphaerales bacterium]|nr:MAG: dTMP kinase [Phycisphaerales bacterium]
MSPAARGAEGVGILVSVSGRASVGDAQAHATCRIRLVHDAAPTPPEPAPAFLHALEGRFIVFDGPDGSGKTTQLRRFTRACRARGVRLCEVREPGGTPVGERVRDILLDRAHEEMAVRCETLLYMASRAQLVEQVIRPALAQGELVVADRFVSSTLAYQGAAGGIPIDDINTLARIACDSVRPDLVVIFDVDERAAAKRLGLLLDRMEAKGAAFHKRVREGYLEQARAEPDRHLVIDASHDADTVTASLFDALSAWASAHA